MIHFQVPGPLKFRISNSNERALNSPVWVRCVLLKQSAVSRGSGSYKDMPLTATRMSVAIPKEERIFCLRVIS